MDSAEDSAIAWNDAIACPHCRAANPPGGAFCESCGKALPSPYRTGPRVIGGPAREAMKAVLAEVQDGSFVRALMADHDAGFPELLANRARLARHPIEATGEALAEAAKA